MNSIGAIAIGAVLVVFGAIGSVRAREIVEKQHREGMTAFADGEIDDATRTLVTRWTAIAFLLVGLAAIAYGVGLG